MMRILLSVGCNRYSTLNTLCGAERDATSIYGTLVDSTKHYSSEHSALLLSPSKSDFDTALDKIVALSQPLDVFTLYFSGHGGVKDARFFFCFSDTNTNRLSTTAYPLLSLFPVLSELQPRQINVIIDACQSGGISYDMNAIIKPELLGPRESTSISFLAATASDESARDGGDGSPVTLRIVDILQGTRKLYSHLKHLDLVDVGRAVSQELVATGDQQRPCFWGLNLYGESQFAMNPHFEELAASDTPLHTGVSPLSSAGKVIGSYAESLWSEYQGIANEFDARRLVNLLHTVYTALGDDHDSICRFVLGVLPSLARRGTDGPDVLAKSSIYAVGAVSLARLAENAVVQKTVDFLLETKRQVDAEVTDVLLKSLQDDGGYLICRESPYADLHYLPVRVTGVLAWIGSSIVTDMLLEVVDSEVRKKQKLLIALMLTQYRDALVAVSDDQASHVALAMSALQLLGEDDIGIVILCRLFGSLVDGRGVLTCNASDVDVFKFTLDRANNRLSFAENYVAKPMEILTVLATWGVQFKLQHDFDQFMEVFDHRFCNAFLMHAAGECANEFMETGENVAFRVGFDVWTIGEIAAGIASRVAQASYDSWSAQEKIVSALAAFLFPDRVPYHLAPLKTSNPEGSGTPIGLPTSKQSMPTDHPAAGDTCPGTRAV